MSGNFNIRVYGIHLNKNKELLLSDEFVLNTKMIKFPGGGLEFGEGPEDCLKREAIEEFGQEIEIKEHFYTTHFFQKALFFENTQLISIYYFFEFKAPIKFRITTKPFDFTELKEGSQSFRYASLSKLFEEDLSFPIDKYVLKRLKEKFLK